MNLKEALLSFDGVIDNEYLDRYVELVSDTISFPNATYTEAHHIIPVSFYYKERDASISYHMHKRTVAEADTRNRLVQLAFKDHCLAHWLLCWCTTDTLGHAMRVAFLHMTGFKLKLTDTLTEEELNYLQHLRNELMETDPFYWTPEEDYWLINNRASYSLKECAEILHKTFGAVATRCNKLGLTQKQSDQIPWTTEETNYLIANYSSTPITDLAKSLPNRTRAAIQIKAQSLKLQKEIKGIGNVGNGYKHKNQIEEQKQWLLDNYIINYSIPECRSILGLSRSRLCTLARELGINTRSKKPSTKLTCSETGETFGSIQEAMEVLGISRFLITKAINTGVSISSSSNLRYTNVHLKELD
jgi:hypothetical protein